MLSSIRSGLLAPAAVVALAAGALGAPAANAAAPAPVTTNPQATPAPGFAATGVRTQGCEPGETPGWVGLGDVTLGVSVQSPDGAASTARFSVRDERTGQAVKTTAPVTGGTAAVKPGNLVDGRTFAWQAQALTAHATGRPTPWCSFRVDTTPPSTLAVTSTDFPATGTPAKYAGQYGTFTITGTDKAPATGAASGVACYQVVLQGTLGVHQDCHGANMVPAAADGSATVRLRPADWGTNVLQVQAMDNAGNVAGPLSYTFYARSNPNPPNTPGDVNGDGVPDILLPDAAGNLQVISADATGTTPSSTVPAVLGPWGSWAGSQLVHRGSDGSHAPMDDLLAYRPGGTALYDYRNFDYGVFGRGAMLLDRPDSWDIPDLPADFPADWSNVEQLAELGPLDDSSSSALLTVEGGNLWLFDSPLAYRTVRQLSTTGTWSGYDVIAPGKAADGSLALWSREKATGELRSYPIGKNADGTYDFAALADPAGGTVIGSFPVADYPTLGSSGDGNGDGKPDLYAVTAARHLLTFDGVTAPKDLGLLK
ncbi:hypothetical protein [Kitasatospora sp. McL0602]|uniref:hypothetical protein n=1 Tax=Kitasatospora sp. McL0602 TaxID=3439530 RepID=UPI003F898373